LLYHCNPSLFSDAEALKKQPRIGKTDMGCAPLLYP
jgi:hypothetical protein